MQRFWLFIAVTLIFVTTALASSSIDVQYSFGMDSMDISYSGTFCEIRIPDCHYDLNPGYPDVPVVNKEVLLPEHTKATEIRIKSITWEAFPQKTIPRPQPYPHIYSRPAILPQPEPALVYQMDNPYPENPAKLCESFTQNGKSYTVLKIYPVRCFPMDKTIEILKNIDLEIVTELSDQMISPVIGPDDYSYLIVGAAEFESTFAPFIEWKTRKGVKTRYIQIEWIESNYAGEDKAAKIRNAIKAEKTNHNIEFVLLVGNKNYIPIRYAYAIDTEDLSGRLGADLYYADHDGSWNDNNDNTYGMVDDNIDLYSDVYVGRAWADDVTDVETFISKILQYEQSPPEDYVTDTAFLAEVLWQFPMTDAAIHKNMIDDTCFPQDWPEITKLYQTSGNETVETVLNTMNAGGHFLNHVGHAGSTGWSVGDGMIFTHNILALQNIHRLWIIHTVGCLSNQFTLTCMGSTFMTNPNGGAVAYMGNFSYGWGMPGSPGFGVSDLFDTKFWDLLFEDPKPQIGKVFADLKAYFVPQSREGNVFRWLQYSLNLNGDPEMPVWTRDPVTLDVDHPMSLSTSSTNPTVWVFKNGEVVSGARVCFYRENECHEVVFTDETGFASVTLPAGLSGPVKLTVTALNGIPYQSDIPVDGMPDLQVSSISIADDETGYSHGDNDGHCEPGETIDVSPVLINNGSNPATTITGTLSVDSSYVTVLSDESHYSDLNGGESGGPLTPFTIEISDQCPPNTPVMLVLRLEFNGSDWTCRFSLPIDQETLTVNRYFIYDMIPGNGNGVLEPGESAYIGLELENSGRSCADHPVVQLTSNSSQITVLSDTIEFPSIDPGEIAMGFDRFWVQASESVNRIPDLTFDWNTVSCSSMPLEFSITIGETGLFDDMDDQTSHWQHDHQPDGWSIVDYRSYSGDYALYCGDSESHQYMPEMDCALTSPAVFITENATISFMRWFEFPLFGEDGLKVEYLDGEWKQIGFVGGGGALSNLQSEWDRVSFEIPLENTMTQFRLRFVASDANVGEGIYIDDISIDCDGGSVWTSALEISSDPPMCDRSGVKLNMPRNIFEAGDTCKLTAWICNSGTSNELLNLYAVMDVFGEFYFAPSWNRTGDFIELTVEAGQSSQTILPEFSWPEIAGETNGLMFWAGLVDRESGSLFGEYDFWEFGWK